MSSPHDDLDLPGLHLTDFPAGLRLCLVCHEARGVALLSRYDGELFTMRSQCPCEGIPCHCGKGMTRMPACSYFDWRAGRWRHKPHFSRGMCRRCEERERRRRER